MNGRLASLKVVTPETAAVPSMLATMRKATTTVITVRMAAIAK